MSLATIRKQLRALGTPGRAAVSRRYFKTGSGQYAEGDKFIGIAVPSLRALAREHTAIPIGDIASLLKSRWHEERMLALLICVRRYAKRDSHEKDAIHALYLRNTRHINNWDLVDLSAEHIVGSHLPPGKRQLLVRLARSQDVWERRIAMLSTFAYIKAGDFGDALRIATMLLDDDHDLIHKAVGWMMREVGNRDLPTELVYLDKYAPRMNRTTLRYAIERFPGVLKKQYMAAGRGPNR